MPFEIVRNDITNMKVDAIVNAANRSLLGGGGVDGAIHRAAGPELLAECRTLNGCETGEAKLTGGYRLPARYVIHTVGPIWHGGNNGEKELLTACYANSLALAKQYDCESVAFPLISAGAYGYPKDQAMSVAIDTISHFLFDNDMMVYLVVFGRSELLSGKKLFRDVQEYIDDVYVDSHIDRYRERVRENLWHNDELAALQMDIAPPAAHPSYTAPQMEAPMLDGEPDWKQLLGQTDDGFSRTLLGLIDEKKMTDVECYKRANIDRKLFSKIRSNEAYKPSKATALAFAVALRLDLPETERLLKSAGFSLTHSSKFDIIVEYFIKTRNYDVFEINSVLFEFDMPLLGSGIS